MHKWVASTGAFYDTSLPQVIPEEAVEVPDELIAELFGDGAAGKVIVAGKKGMPTLADPKPTPVTAASVRRQRLNAYLAESDPLKIEAEYDALSADGTPNYKKWMAKVQEIKERFPLP